MHYARQNCATEWSFESGKPYADPFAEVTLDVVITDPGGQEMCVPAFWAGGQRWTVRWSPTLTGTHRWRSVCSDPGNSDLHDRGGEIEVASYEGSNPLLQHGRLRVSANRRYLEHLDGTPFFWLADTWWMGLCQRLSWPTDFHQLVADRVEKGFSVIQIVGGLYPDMGPFDERGKNEAGFAWEPEFARVNPAYYDMADLRIQYLVARGLTPCIVGCWGYYLLWLGEEKMKQHWRNLVARWGAYPVVWCLAGEGVMPYYLTETREADQEQQRAGWTRLAEYVRQVDPYRHPLSIHPTDTARNQVLSPEVLDFEMLQTGHGDRASIPNTIRLVTQGYQQTPTMPVLNSEVCYEGIGEASREEIQRFMFWSCLLSGACGHTYGANGIWQVNRPEAPYGPSPHGMSWGNRSWQEAAQLPGSRQLGLAKALLERFPWWRFEPHPEWIEPHWTPENYLAPYAAGIPGEVRVFFLPTAWGFNYTVTRLEPGVSYTAFLWNPVDASEIPLGTGAGSETGDWRLPLDRPPIFQDWVLVLHRV